MTFEEAAPFPTRSPALPCAGRVVGLSSLPSLPLSSSPPPYGVRPMRLLLRPCLPAEVGGCARPRESAVGCDKAWAYQRTVRRKNIYADKIIKIARKFGHCNLLL